MSIRGVGFKSNQVQFHNYVKNGYKYSITNDPYGKNTLKTDPFYL